jgi:alkylation response protein AidB-like acyl-CoA dehydrogenase
MTHNTHPSSLLNNEWISLLRKEAPIAEQHGSLTPAQLELIYEQGWFRLYVPEVYTRSIYALPEALHLIEALSWADGSVGWTVTLCSGAGWFGGFMDTEVAAAVFSSTDVCLGGSGAATGTANRTTGGYVINGKWKYATGTPHLTHFTANCIITEGEDVVLNKDGEPLILPFIFKKEEVQPIHDWRTIGLVATASQSFEIRDLIVPANRCFPLVPEGRKVSQPIYNYPFLPFAEVTLAVNSSGMAIHFLDCCKDSFAQRIESRKATPAQEQLLTERLAQAKDRLSKARMVFYEVVEASWQLVLKDTTVPASLLEEISLSSRHLAATARDVVDQLYPLCGLQAADPLSEINRVWRDLHTASQHSLLNFR